MMNSISKRFPNGFGNDSGELGHNIMDHHLGVGASAEVPGYLDMNDTGRRPTGYYIPRYRNVGKDKRDYVRGFGYQGRGNREVFDRFIETPLVGPELKQAAMEPGAWRIGMQGFGEILPDHANHVKLNRELKDKWGLPTLTFDAKLRANELKMRKDMLNDAAEMLESAGYKDIRSYDNETGIGLGIHEMGTARMGKDPKTSVLNKWNQVHACKNVYVTDGSCMTSAACQNPSLTYMALTARAADHAVGELKRMNI
jgi:choline dehydrogenase-like flavoprotein